MKYIGKRGSFIAAWQCHNARIHENGQIHFFLLSGQSLWLVLLCVLDPHLHNFALLLPLATLFVASVQDLSSAHAARFLRHACDARFVRWLDDFALYRKRPARV